MNEPVTHCFDCSVLWNGAIEQCPEDAQHPVVVYPDFEELRRKIRNARGLDN